MKEEDAKIVAIWGIIAIATITFVCFVSLFANG